MGGKSDFLLLLVLNSGAAPAGDERHEIYLETCRESCRMVSHADEATECRENFCPEYVEYLSTGHVDKDAKPTLASSHEKEVAEFCATWLVQLIDQFGWQNHVRLNLQDCVCAAGKNCLVK